MNAVMRVPPHSQEAEQGAIGAVLLDPGALLRMDVHLGPDHFYVSAHRDIWAAMLELQSRRHAIDVITVFEHLRAHRLDESAGGLAYISSLPGSVASAASLRDHARIIVDHALRRRIIQAADAAQALAHAPGDAAEQLDQVASLFAAIKPSTSRGEPTRLNELLLARSGHWDALASGAALAGMPTHLPTVDAALGGGLKAGSVLVIGARPSVGKTSIAMQILLNVAAGGHPVLLCSQEMQAGDLADRAAANLGRVDLSAITRGRLQSEDWARLTEASERASGLPMFIDDTPALSLLDIKAKARRIQQRHGLAVVAVDYLQLCSSGGRQESRHHQIEAISRGLKQLAKELGVCVIVLSQVNRQASQRVDGEPTLADLKESGAVEEDADTVMVLHPKGNLPDGSLLIAALLLKNRQGRRGRIALAFNGPTQRWVESTADVSTRGGA